MFADSMTSRLLELIFNNANAADIGDATGLRGSTSAGNLYISLHTADPGKAGAQNTNEATYTSYARVAVTRAGTAWSVSGDHTIENVNAITFPACTGGSNTITHWGIGTASSGAGVLLMSGPVTILTGFPKEAIGKASDNTITLQTGHGFVVDDRIVFSETPVAFGDAIGGITPGTVYWVKTQSGDVITISTTQGGAELDITNDGAGLAQEAAPLAVSSGITPSFAAAELFFIID